MTTIAQPSNALRVLTIKDQVAERIRSGIFAGEWIPGERIVELEVARRLQVGQTSVREALFDLERQGFVVRSPNKGTHVKRFTAQQAEQVYRVRLAIEALAVELMLNRAEADDLLVLKRIADEMSAVAETGSSHEFYRLDLEFHRAIWRFSGNPYLAETLESLVPPLFVFYVCRLHRTREQLRIEAQSHQALLESLRVLEPKAARSYYESAIATFSDPDAGTAEFSAQREQDKGQSIIKVSPTLDSAPQE